MKKAYNTPKLTAFGSLGEITLQRNTSPNGGVGEPRGAGKQRGFRDAGGSRS